MSLEENTGLSELDIKIVEQASLEQKIQRDANRTLIKKETEADLKRLQKTQQRLNKLKYELKKLYDKLDNPRTKISEKEELRKHIKMLKDSELFPTEQDLADINERLAKNPENHASTEIDAQNSDEKLPNESEKDYLIRTGKLTAFGNSTQFVVEEDQAWRTFESAVSHQELKIPSLEEFSDNCDVIEDKGDEWKNGYDGENIYEKSKKRRYLTEDDIRNTDDGNESFYQNRLNSWCHKRRLLRHDISHSDESEWKKPHPTMPDAILNDEYRVPGDIYPSLFDYQKTGVQWLYELHCQNHGGIISDEMGLGKTIQIIAFLAGLHYSGKLEKPVLIVCPTTVMTQWVNEFHTWWPPFRTILLHSIGSAMSKKGALNVEEKMDRLLMKEDDVWLEGMKSKSLSQVNSLQNIVDTILEKGHVLITSYVGLKIYEDHLLKVNWGYVVLDEGHKIKNPNSNITILAKRLKTYNRIILSGTPIQNNLIELWSLFDFIYPGRLGTLPIFQEEFEDPIKTGGYANASNLDVKVGYQKAVLLKELIQPFLLRRVKADVARDLPSKQEYVLMCRLTQYQKEKYLLFLKSTEFKANSYLGAIDTLRKICNHPDLTDVHFREGQLDYGDASKSGKLQVLKSILETWKQQGHKILLFTQTKQMMFILDKFMHDVYPNFKYMKMSGATSIAKRQDMIYAFNNEDYDLFLLTTKVGGLGVNLTGADRVIIFDPDWNPSTDLQARERAWRLGQKKDVLIYRLIIGGSIEEKIYHRQIFKQLLTDKILKDPNQKRFFKNKDLHDLFTLSDFDDEGTANSLFKTDQRRKEADDLEDLSKIQGVSKLELFSEKLGPQGEDDRLMSELFNRTNAIKGALKHDDIVETHSKPNDDLLDREARRAANKALNALTKSRKQVKSAGVGVPTFTGKFGIAGRLLPNAKRSSHIKPKASSSFSILTNLKKQKQQDEKVSAISDSSDENIRMMSNMKEYLSNRPEFSAKSADILDHLMIGLNDRKDLSLVRSMLRSISTWDTTKKGWTLKQEFR